MSVRLRAGFLVLTAFVAACSLVVDTDGLAGGTSAPDAATSGADARVAADDASGEHGAEDGGGGAGGDAAGVRDTGVPPSCDSFKLSITGCTEDPTFFPANGTAVRIGATEVIVLAQYEPAASTTIVTDNRTTPHVLVLASYSATKWKLVAKAPSAVTVILSGYELSSLDDAQNQADTPYAYKYPSNRADDLFAYAKTKTASDVSGAAMCYGTTGFTIADACP